MATLMWEVRAAEGRLDDLIVYVNLHAGSSALVFRSAEPDPRVVLIDPSGHGIAEVPDELIAGPPHSWPFERVERPSAGLR